MEPRIGIWEKDCNGFEMDFFGIGKIYTEFIFLMGFPVLASSGDLYRSAIRHCPHYGARPGYLDQFLVPA